MYTHYRWCTPFIILVVYPYNMYDILGKYSSTLFFGPYILGNVNGHNAAE